jgi:phosphohistidine phosphatase
MGSATHVRRLVVLRHAESEGEVEGKGDHARTLHERGRRDAARVGLRLRDLGFVPRVVVSSDATRTRETWDHMRQALGGAPAVTFTRAFYLMGIDEIRAVLREQAPEVDTVMVIGHNPGWEDAVHSLSGVRARMMPCAAALLRITADTWAEAAERDDWDLDELLRPDAR